MIVPVLGFIRRRPDNVSLPPMPPRTSMLVSPWVDLLHVTNQQACNTAGLYSTALRLFDQLTAASNPSPRWPSEYAEKSPRYPGDSDSNSDSDPSEPDSDMDADTDLRTGSDGPEIGGSLTSSSEDPQVSRSQLQKQRAVRRKGEGPAEENEKRSAERALDGGFGDSSDEDVGGGGREGGGSGRRERDSVGAAAMGMGFENLNDIPDGELIPAAAATIALESCFLGGRRDQAMEIVWQVNGLTLKLQYYGGVRSKHTDLSDLWALSARKI